MIVYLGVINILCFIVYGLDKLKAKYHKWRISEKTLLLLAIVGGAYGSYLAMILFHHKTRKFIFKFGIPLILILETCILGYLSYNGMNLMDFFGN